MHGCIFFGGVVGEMIHCDVFWGENLGDWGMRDYQMTSFVLDICGYLLDSLVCAGVMFSKHKLL